MILPKQTYNPFEGFKPYVPGTPQTTEDFASEVQKMASHYNKQMQGFVKHFNTEQGKHNTTIDSIKRASGVASEITINNLISSSGSSGGGSGTSPSIRCRTESLTANVTKTVVFSSAIGATFAIASIRVYNSTNLYITDFTISNITASSFDIVCPETATMIYLAVEET